MERQDFEDSWKKAFDQAEVPPSGNVWTNIELDLERSKGSKLRRKLVFFQLLAAASVIFSLGVGAGVFLMKSSDSSGETQIASTEPHRQTENAIAEPPASSDLISADKPSEKTFSPSITTTPNDYTSTTNSSRLKTAKLFTKKPARPTEEDQNQFDAVMSLANENGEHKFFGPDKSTSLAFSETRDLPPLTNRATVQLHLNEINDQNVIDPVQLMLAKLDQREREVRGVEESKEKRSGSNEKLWTSVGFAAGSFNRANGGLQQGTPNQPQAFALQQSSSIAEKEAKASGISYSVGANIGTKIAKRWVFQGGLNYLTQSADYMAQDAIKSSSDATTFRPASINELKKISGSDAAEENVVNTAPYNVNNSLRYLSIPMQAGFLLVNRNVGLQLNAGVSTDVFLQNVVSADGGSLTKTTDNLGDKSSYRAVNLSGLAGTEISYRFSKNYRVALNPGIRYPFNSIYKSDAQVSSTPITFDIGLRFRYIFH